MATCSFFGHRIVTQKIEPLLTAIIVDLIENYAVDTFLVGNQGGFDGMVKSKLIEIKQKYTHIKYSVVLAYLPAKKYQDFDFSDTVYPSVLDGVPPRARIICRNDWMIKKSDFVVTYVTHNVGGAAEAREKAEKKGKKVINISF